MKASPNSPLNPVKIWLMRLGIIKPENADTIIVELDSEDLRDYEEVERLEQEIKELRKEFIKLEALLKTKNICHQNMKDLLWQGLEDKYKIAKNNLLYIDKLCGYIRIRS